jgi:SsrA-binding protein
MKAEDIKIVATNRKAKHNYFLEEHLEAGLALRGSEIKSVRLGRVSLQEAYVRVEGSELWLQNANIAAYDPASRLNHDPKRPRKLLLHRREIDKLQERMQQKGYVLVPTRMYLRSGRAKLEISLARGKRQYDKRRALAEKDAVRAMQRELGRRR